MTDCHHFTFGSSTFKIGKYSEFRLNLYKLREMMMSKMVWKNKRENKLREIERNVDK